MSKSDEQTNVKLCVSFSLFSCVSMMTLEFALAILSETEAKPFIYKRSDPPVAEIVFPAVWIYAPFVSQMLYTENWILRIFGYVAVMTFRFSSLFAR